MSYPLAKNSPTTSKSLPFSELLSSAELETLNARIAANADQWLADNAPKTKTKLPRKPKSTRGPKPKMIENPFYGFIGRTTCWGLYPVFALDIIEGVAQLDWHDRQVGVGGKSMPLSVLNLAVILESLPVISNEAVEDLLQLEERHARRYFKAIQSIVPCMVKSRPQSLLSEMEAVEPDPKACEWDDRDDLYTPSAEELARLHHDLRTFTQFKSAEEYEQNCSDELTGKPTDNVVRFLARNQHPKRAEVMALLTQEISKSEIERTTGVQRKTIRKWQAEALVIAA